MLPLVDWIESTKPNIFCILFNFTYNTSGNVLWLLTDHLGTIKDLVDNSGTIVNHITYDSYGNVSYETDDTVNSRYLFTGREFDEVMMSDN